jgi:hypothetical protein
MTNDGGDRAGKRLQLAVEAVAEAALYGEVAGKRAK